MIASDFCAFILTHGRADNVVTFKSLRNAGYSGPVVIVIDDEDEQRDTYIKNFGAENVEIFSKDEIAKTFDLGDNFGKKGAIIYARNVCFNIARKRGYRYFIELDDDYTFFGYTFDSEFNFKESRTKKLDDILSAMLDYFRNTPTLTTIAMAQGGDFIGGGNGTLGRNIPKRKAMNSFICDVERQFKFVGTINEDVNTYTSEGARGKIFLTVPMVRLEQKRTQKNKGGMTDLYLDSGTYVKSFYTVLYMPSAVKISVLGGDAEKRIHHFIKWDSCVPKILSEKYRKS